jgi:hypothetical protein
MMLKCEMSFVCDKKWTDLTATEFDATRFCGDCKQNVFIVKTELQFLIARAFKRCVAIADDNNFIGVIGQTSAFDWMEQEVKEISVSLSKPIDAARRMQLRLLFPAIFDNADNECHLMSGEFVRVGTFDAEKIKFLQHEIDAVGAELCVHAA